MATKKIISSMLNRKPGMIFSEVESETSFLQNGVDIRLEFAKILVSLWSHACMADGAFHAKEGTLVGEMVKALFEPGSILSDYSETKDEIVDILSDIFDLPLPMKTILKVVEGNDQYALNFYEDALCIVSTDGKLKKEERAFLDELALEFQLNPIDKQELEKKYNLH
jgi:uncharacterized membrane protein YebE (DUF533 family)